MSKRRRSIVIMYCFQCGSVMKSDDDSGASYCLNGCLSKGEK